jgi:hypothetical protein
MSLVHLLKSPTILLFPSKELDHSDTREIFVEKRIHLGDLQTDFPKRLSGSMAEEKGRNKDQGNNRKGDQSEFPVEMKEKDDDPDQQKNIFYKVNKNRGEHFMDILDIVGQSGH